MGIRAPRARPTWQLAALSGLVVAIPCGCLIQMVWG